MAFQTPITIERALQGITTHEYVLPAIQREFVWKPEQICAFFDSLMRRYPIGSFLFWEIPTADLGDYVFYDFIRNYHERRAAHCEVVPKDALPASKPTIAILDGQQRMTALNVGLRGSHAKRLPRRHWKNPDAFPKKKLYLNIAVPAKENDDKLMYDFRFLTKDEATGDKSDGAYWFPVPKIRDLTDGTDAVGIFRYIREAGLAAENDFAFQALDRLRQLVFQDGVVSYYSVDERELDNVLDIFIRVNSGGTVLSYSDLLLSIATAQFKDRDARQDVNRQVDEINATGKGFSFTKDVVLKGGLVLSDIGDIRFKVTNFNRQNMHTLEKDWDSIAASLKLATALLAAFGFSDRTLSAAYVLLPLAYYVKLRGLDDSYLTSSAHEADRKKVRFWVLRSLLKAGIWGSGQDTLLSRLREAIRKHGEGGFPAEQVEAAMAPIGKSLKFGAEEIDELLDLQYGKPRTFVTLALLYPKFSFETVVHVDHIFPQKLFYKKSLAKAGVPAEEQDDFTAMMNGLPNLQLLPGPVNTQKQAMLPRDWIDGLTVGGDEEHAAAGRDAYLAQHDMHGLPDGMLGFPDFFEARRARMRERLETLLGVQGSQ
ncbi:MAG TPA: DUF262 domain-containing protein [Thermoleophilia bacterium]|nr:DUF262 domain-containing protein [Thermoleophilia bacterium]